jgi:hypothetical protein
VVLLVMLVIPARVDWLVILVLVGLPAAALLAV